MSGNRQHPAEICPSAIRAFYLKVPCSSVLLANVGKQVYCVVGKTNGEVLFFSVDRANTCVSRIGDFDSPITALTVGDLRHTGRTELIAISSNGWLRAIEFPSRNVSSNSDGQLPIDTPPRVTYCQLLNANICAAHLIDIDNDGKQEMVVAMTDRVVRTYRYMESEKGHWRVTSLNKCEVPTQICAVTIGYGRCGGGVIALLTQLQAQYVRIELGGDGAVSVHQSATITATADDNNQQLFIPTQIARVVSLMHTLPTQLLLVDEQSTDDGVNNETELKRGGGGPIVSAAAVTLVGGTRLLFTVDLRGVLMMHSWNVQQQHPIRSDPLARAHILTNVEHMSATVAGDDSVYVAVVTVYQQVAIYLIKVNAALMLRTS